MKSDKSGRQAKTIQNVAGGNFTRGFAARKFPRGLRPRDMAAPPPLARSQIPPLQFLLVADSIIEQLPVLEHLQSDSYITNHNFDYSHFE